jgi:hypothetical protein
VDRFDEIGNDLVDFLHRFFGDVAALSQSNERPNVEESFLNLGDHWVLLELGLQAGQPLLKMIQQEGLMEPG